jgi:hypothetical protein
VHGVIFAELEKFVGATAGPDAWPKLLAAAGLSGNTYLPIRAYPDQELAALVTAASAATGAPPAQLLEEFGAFIAPSLLNMYQAFINPEWRVLDIIEHTEATIHKTVRLRQPDARPPELKVARISDNEALITYTSPRRMCAVAKGIAKGIAQHYREQLVISERSCMLQGGSACQISVKSLA